MFSHQLVFPLIKDVHCMTSVYIQAKTNGTKRILQLSDNIFIAEINQRNISFQIIKEKAKLLNYIFMQAYLHLFFQHYRNPEEAKIYRPAQDLIHTFMSTNMNNKSRSNSFRIFSDKNCWKVWCDGIRGTWIRAQNNIIFFFTYQG